MSGSTWLAEAHAACDAAAAVKRIAASLPDDSSFRANLLDWADNWQALAALRGVRLRSELHGVIAELERTFHEDEDNA